MLFGSSFNAADVINSAADIMFDQMISFARLCHSFDR